MVLYDPHKKPSEQKYPILIFCEVITHKLEEQDGYAVPKDHRQDFLLLGNSIQNINNNSLLLISWYGEMFGQSSQ